MRPHSESTDEAWRRLILTMGHEINNSLAVVTNQAELLDVEIERLAGDRDSSVEGERLDAVRREVARISEILARFGEMVRADEVETVTYVGPTKMVDLSSRRRGDKDERLAGLRMLVVDDDDGICRTLKEILEIGGCEVETSCDGAEALMRIQRNKFDLVLSDVVMPNMDGPTMVKELKGRIPDTKIVFVSGYAEDAFAKSLDPDQEFHFLPKPFSLKQLASMVKDVMNG